VTSRAADATGRGERPVPETLRRDVRLLTTLLGDAIRDHGGDELFTTVEALRRAVRRLHERPTPSRAAAVDRVIDGISRDEGGNVARALTAFFSWSTSPRSASASGSSATAARRRSHR